tara:strand:+ start:1106 stop:2017 length:912 start_codon:yes stop_codon:yes gene_type:complete
MAYQSIGLGSSANDGTGDTLRAGGDKVNDNFVELYTLLGTGSALTSGLSATATVVTLTAPVIATSLDLNGSELILDVDADTSITADTDDTIDFKIGGADIFQMTATKLDLNGKELVLDADADTSITADSDDTINIKLGGNDRIDLSTGLVSIKNDGAKSQVRLYCESSNAHYAAVEAPAHAVFSGNITVTLPNKTSTLQGSASETITGAGGSNALDDDIEVSLLDTSSGTASLTLSAGRFVGQRKIIIMTVAGNNATMTQSNGNLNSTNVSTNILFNAVGESVILVYNGSNWNVVSVNGATIS